MQEYYKILGLSDTATDEEIDAAYEKLKAQYREDRFCEGEKGNNAAKQLTRLETAYYEIKESRKKKMSDENNNTTTYDFSNVERFIRNGDLSAAQSELDNFSERNAEWHYLQSVVFYKKNWMSESKKQLEIALNIEPYNTKYSDAYSKLKQKMQYNENQFHSGNVGYDDRRQMGGSDMNGCLSFCATWCCMDMLCSLCCAQ